MLKKLLLISIFLPTILLSGLFAPVFKPGGGSGLPPVGSEGDCLLVSGGSWTAGACPGAGTGAPDTATYITQTADATLSAEQALGSLSTGCLGVTTTTGVVASRTILGTANEITLTNGNCSGNPTVSLPSTLALRTKTVQLQDNNVTISDDGDATKLLAFQVSGVTAGQTRTITIPDASGTMALTTSNVATATALAANGADCAAGEFAQGVTAAGVASGCTALPLTISGTANQITASASTGAITLSLPSTLILAGAQVDFTESAGDGTCAAGDYWIKASSTTSGFRKCQNGTVTDLDTGGGGSISGGLGATDNAVVRTDGVGGSTVQGSSCTIDDTGLMTCPGGFSSSAATTGTLTMLEGTAPGAGTNAGEHNVYFDSADSKLKSHENGGSVVTYARTADNLSVFAATTSAQIAGVANDETGSGALVFGTSPTITTPTISGAIVFPDGVTQTFNPNGTSAGLDIGSNAGDPSAPGNGQMWYNSSTGKFRCRENGSTVDCISTGAGTGDVTDVTAGAGISVANSGGPAPAVTWDSSTFVNNLTFWDGANATRTLTANLSGTDPVITFGSSSVDVTTGTLKEGGVSVSLPARSETLTNKTLDAEGSGNTITIPEYWDLDLVAVNPADGVASHVWNKDPLSTAPTATAVSGTNRTMGVATFPDSDGDYGVQLTKYLPTGFTGNIQAEIWWKTTGTGNARFQIQTKCYADDEADDAAMNTATVTTAAAGTSGRPNKQTTGNIDITGCAAGELMRIRFYRNRTEGSDTLNAALDVEKVVFIVRVAH